MSMDPGLWQAHLTFALLGALALPLAAYLRALVDDLAVTTVIAMGWAIAVRMNVFAPLAAMHRWQLLVGFGLLALLLYPATLGLTYADPYRLGYSPRPLIVAIGLLALLMLHWRNRLGGLMLCAATLAFSLDLKPSDNYWDYLLDPFVAVYCWLALLLASGRRLWQRRLATP